MPFGLKRDLQIGAILHLFPTRHSLYTIGHSCFFFPLGVETPAQSLLCLFARCMVVWTIVTLQHICNYTHTSSSHCSTLLACVLQCNALQHTATHCNTLQHTALHCNTSATIRTHHRLTAAHCWHVCHNATHCNTLQRTATHCNALQRTATHCNTLQHICNYTHTSSSHCSTLQPYTHSIVLNTHCRHVCHAATHCNTLQHTATSLIGAHIHVSVPRCLIIRPIMCQWVVLMYSKTGHELVFADIWRIDVIMHTSYRVAKTHSMPYLYRSFSAKEPYN